jgi:hypothetical protein
MPELDPQLPDDDKGDAREGARGPPSIAAPGPLQLVDLVMSL